MSWTPRLASVPISRLVVRALPRWVAASIKTPPAVRLTVLPQRRQHFKNGRRSPLNEPIGLPAAAAYRLAEQAEAPGASVPLR